MLEYGVSEFVVNAHPVQANVGALTRGWHSMWAGGARDTDAGVQVNESSMMGYAPFWRAVNLIANDVAGMPCDVFRRQRDGGKKYAKTHPAAPLIRYMANSEWRSDEMFRTMTAQTLIHGNAYALIRRDMEGNPLSIHMIDPQQVMVMQEDGVRYYAWYKNGEIQSQPSKNILHIKGLGRDGVMGYPLIQIMANALGVGMAAQKFGAKFFGEGSNMSGLLMVPGHFTEEKIRNTRAAWDSMAAGLKNSSRVALLQDGVKFQQMTIPPEQAQFLQTREFEVRATVANITGVPPHMLGDSTRTSHNSLESESQNYLARCLNPWLKEWERELMTKLLTPRQRIDDTYVIEFNREAEIQMSFESKINGIYRQIEAGVMNRNEARNLLNLPNIGAEGDEFYHPANWVVAGEEPEPMEQSSNGNKSSNDSPDDSPTASVLRSMITTSVTKAVDLETSKAIRLANSRAHEFLPSVDEFYDTWTEHTAPGITSEKVRELISGHAEESRRQLVDVAGVSTTSSLKENVCQLVATWDARRDALIDAIWKEVQK